MRKWFQNITQLSKTQAETMCSWSTKENLEIQGWWLIKAMWSRTGTNPKIVERKDPFALQPKDLKQLTMGSLGLAPTLLLTRARLSKLSISALQWGARSPKVLITLKMLRICLEVESTIPSIISRFLLKSFKVELATISLFSPRKTIKSEDHTYQNGLGSWNCKKIHLEM